MTWDTREDLNEIPIRTVHTDLLLLEIRARDARRSPLGLHTDSATIAPSSFNQLHPETHILQLGGSWNQLSRSRLSVHL